MHGHFDHPRPGQVVNVRFDPKTHKVKLAPDYNISPRKLEQEKAERFQAIADAGPGTDAPENASQQADVTPPSGDVVVKEAGDVRTIRPPD